MGNLKQFFHHHFEQPNYLIFLLSLVLLLILPALAPLLAVGNIVLRIAYGMVILMACVYTSKSYQDLKLLGGLGIVSYTLFILYRQYEVASILNPIVTLLFFGLVFSRLITYVFSPKSVTINDIYALCAGYIIIGVIAAPFFSLLHLQLDTAFSIPPEASFFDLLYFSYITLTGVGYGDITPTHPISRSLSLVLGIVGQLYTAILVGIVIGKYLAGTKD